MVVGQLLLGPRPHPLTPTFSSANNSENPVVIPPPPPPHVGLALSLWEEQADGRGGPQPVRVWVNTQLPPPRLCGGDSAPCLPEAPRSTEFQLDTSPPILGSRAAITKYHRLSSL